VTGIYVLTSPRKTADPWEYLLGVVDHINGEQLTNPKCIVVDGTDDDVVELTRLAPGWIVKRYVRPGSGTWLGGNKWPYWHLLRWARDCGGDDDALVLEDDVVFCVNAVRRMLLLEIPPDVDWLQFFSAWMFTAPNAHPGLWRSPALVQGCQALKFPARTLEKLIAWEEHDPEFQKYNESDVALGLAQQRLGLRCGNHMPDLVQHVGQSSNVSHGMHKEAGIDGSSPAAIANHSLVGRVSVNFSRQFDAMKLFARHDLYR
jgi:hypothetical protein